jgi:hypothetical protein
MGADVRYVLSAENRSAGAVMRHQLASVLQRAEVHLRALAQSLTGRHPRLHGSVSCPAWFLSVFPPQGETAASGRPTFVCRGNVVRRSSRAVSHSSRWAMCLAYRLPVLVRVGRSFRPSQPCPEPLKNVRHSAESVALNRAAKQDLAGPYGNEQRFILERWRSR